MEKYKSIMKNNNMKCTRARFSILKLLIEEEKSLSADYIYETCKMHGINVDLSTVYRTLELFYEKDLVQKFDIGKGKYEYTFKEDNHKHILKCELCHKQVEIDCPIPQIKEMVKDKTGFAMVELEDDIKFKGICEECIGKNKKK